MLLVALSTYISSLLSQYHVRLCIIVNPGLKIEHHLRQLNKKQKKIKQSNSNMARDASLTPTFN